MVRQYAYSHFMASAMTQTSQTTRAILEADKALAAFDARFPSEDSETAPRCRQLELQVKSQEAALGLCEGKLKEQADTISLCEGKIKEMTTLIQSLCTAAGVEGEMDLEQRVKDLAAAVA